MTNRADPGANPRGGRMDGAVALRVSVRRGFPVLGVWEGSVLETLQHGRDLLRRRVVERDAVPLRVLDPHAQALALVRFLPLAPPVDEARHDGRDAADEPHDRA